MDGRQISLLWWTQHLGDFRRKSKKKMLPTNSSSIISGVKTCFNECINTRNKPDRCLSKVKQTRQFSPSQKREPKNHVIHRFPPIRRPKWRKKRGQEITGRRLLKNHNVVEHVPCRPTRRPLFLRETSSRNRTSNKWRAAADRKRERGEIF